MITAKTLITSFQDVVWLFIILVICATTIAAWSLLSRPGFSHFRQIAARYF